MFEFIFVIFFLNWGIYQDFSERLILNDHEYFFTFTFFIQVESVNFHPLRIPLWDFRLESFRHSGLIVQVVALKFTLTGHFQLWSNMKL